MNLVSTDTYETHQIKTKEEQIKEILKCSGLSQAAPSSVQMMFSTTDSSRDSAQANKHSLSRSAPGITLQKSLMQNNWCSRALYETESYYINQQIINSLSGQTWAAEFVRTSTLVTVVDLNASYFLLNVWTFLNNCLNPTIVLGKD